LKEMKIKELDGKGYIPAYTRTEITIHCKMYLGLNGLEIISKKYKKKNILKIRKRNSTFKTPKNLPKRFYKND